MRTRPGIFRCRISAKMHSSLRVLSEVKRRRKVALMTLATSRCVIWTMAAVACIPISLEQAKAEVPCKDRWLGQLAPQLEKLAPGIPMPLLLGWIEVESGGDLKSSTSLDERGYFQLMPDESKQLNLDHQRLSTDSEYSLQGGIRLVELYAKTVDSLGYSRSDPDFWRMVKFEHAIGPGSVQHLLKDMQTHRITSRSWVTIEQYSKLNEKRLLHDLKHDPVKWTANVDKVFAQGSQLEKEWHEKCRSPQLDSLNKAAQ